MRMEQYHQKPRYRITRRGYLALFLILFLLAVLLEQCMKDKPQEAVYPETIGTIPITTDLIPQGYAGRTGIERNIKWIVIHETGNTASSATAENHNAFLHNEKQMTNSTSWHYTVDDTEIYHHLPDNEVGYHAGDQLTEGGGNACGIGIEICVNDGGDYQKAVDNAAQLTAYLLKVYDLPLKNVKQHGDFMNKNCPQRLRDSGGWEDFLVKVKTYQKDF